MAGERVRSDTHSARASMHAEDMYRIFEHFLSSPSFNRALYGTLDRYFDSNSTLLTGHGPGSRSRGEQESQSSYRSSRRGGHKGKPVDKAGDQLRDKREAAAAARHEQEAQEKEARRERERLTADIKRRNKNFSIFTQQQLRDELEDLHGSLKLAKAERRGLDYKFFGDLRREIDSLEHQEGTRFRGWKRKLLTSNPITGDLADVYYNRKDAKRERQKQRSTLDKDIQGLKDRITAIGGEMLDASSKLDQNMELTVEAIEGTQHVEEANNKILKKLLKQLGNGAAGGIAPGPNGTGAGGLGGFLGHAVGKLFGHGALGATVGEMIGDFSGPATAGAVEGIAKASVGGILKLVGLLAAPEVIGGLVAVFAALWAKHEIQALLATSKEREKKVNEQKKEQLGKLETNPANANVPKQQLKESVELQRTEAPGTSQPKLAAYYKEEYIKDRQKELDHTHVTKEASKRIMDAEWNDAVHSPKIDPKNPVWRILAPRLKGNSKITEEAPDKAIKTPKNSATAAVATKLTGLTSVAAPISQMQRRTGHDPDATKTLQLGPSADLNGLNPAMKTNLLWMADEYLQLTGKKMPLNAAYMSLEQQQAAYAKDPSKVPKPGTSLHEFGFAVDTNPEVADWLAKNGLLDKYGFVRNVSKSDGQLESWHLEPAGIQGQRAAILSQLAAKTVSGASVENQTPPSENPQADAAAASAHPTAPSAPGQSSAVGSKSMIPGAAPGYEAPTSIGSKSMVPGAEPGYGPNPSIPTTSTRGTPGSAPGSDERTVPTVIGTKSAAPGASYGQEQPSSTASRSVVRLPVASTRGSLPPPPGSSVARVSPIPQTQYQRTPYSSPGQSAAMVSAARMGGSGRSDPAPAAGGGGGASSGFTGLSDIPMMVDNLPLILYTTGAVR